MTNDYGTLAVEAGALIGLIGVTTIRGVIAADPISTALGATATILGLAALIWKLVTDHKVEQHQAERWEAMLTRSDRRIAELETEIARLNTLLAHRRLADDDT